MDYKLKIGFQGEKGAYSDMAIDGLYPDQAVEKLPYRTAYDVIEALKKDQINFGLLPIENSIIGPITHTYDLLLENKLKIAREIIIPIHHALLTAPGVKLSDLKRVYSHPAAIAQCEMFIRTMKNVDILPTYDTAGSAKIIAEQRLHDTGAIAGAGAAALYGLSVVQENIEDYPHNQTRFLLLSVEDIQFDQEEYVPSKVSGVFDTLDQPGMLFHVLEIFNKHKVNLTSIASRPNKTEPWKYHFFIDMDGHLGDENITNAFSEIKKMSGFIHAFGSYPKYLPKDQQTRQQGPAKKAAGKPSGPLYSLSYRKEPTIVEVGNVRIGGGSMVMIAGPCSVEGRQQMMETAKIVSEHGADLLRGGAFKPRTSPYSFQGLGVEGLRLMREAREAFGLPIVTEVLAVEELAVCAEYADVLQIGARNMQNFVLLREVGKTGKPVLLKRGLMATVKELLMSAEYILAAGNPHVILCERGIRTFETATRNTLDIAAVPVLKEQTHLPVIVDPSHATGVASLIEPVSKAAVAVGADGLMVEVHFNPSTALSDAEQALDERAFKSLMQAVKKLTDRMKS